LKSQIRGYRQAQRNALDGMSLVQVAEGGLNEISNLMTRLRELGVQASSDTVGEQERSFIDKEVQQLKLESQRIAETTKFGSTHLLDGTADSFEFQVDINNNEFQDRISFNPAEQIATVSELGVEDFDFTTKEGAQSALEVLESAQTSVNGMRANLGAVQNRLISTQDNLGVQIENLSAANSRVRDADFAESSAEMARSQILLNASTGVLAQANQMPSQALRLLA
jgi:flagellin